VRLSLLLAAILGLSALSMGGVDAAEPGLAAGAATTARETFEVDDAGARHGSYVRLHENGRVAVRAAYHHGEVNGVHKTYDDTGRLLVQKTFRKGRLHGSWKAYHPNKRLKLTANYRGGVLHGKYLVRGPKGLTRLKTTYKDGVVNGKLQAFEGRREISRQTWREGVPTDVDGVRPFDRDRAHITSEVQRLLKGDGGLSSAALAADRELALRYLQAYRCIIGVPYDDIAIDPTFQAHAQAAAGVCRDLGHITHFPENPGWERSRFDFAAIGTKSSNLAQGLIACQSIRGYMDDSDARNIAKVGHRAWCMNPRMSHTGFGTVDHFSAMWSISGARKQVPDYDVVACPPPGYAPSAWFGTHWAWSASLNKKTWDAPHAGAVSVEVIAVGDTFLPEGKPLALDHQSVLAKSTGIPYMVVFRPVSFSLKPGTRYRVTVDGLTSMGNPRQLRYYVEFYDLAYPAPTVPGARTATTASR
jgi:hypothetical protein